MIERGDKCLRVVYEKRIIAEVNISNPGSDCYDSLRGQVEAERHSGGITQEDALRIYEEIDAEKCRSLENIFKNILEDKLEE